MITRNVLRIVAAGAILGSPLTVIGVEAAGAETVLVSCTGVHAIITLNPTTGSGDARYTKWTTKDSDGTKVDLLGNPIPADTQSCSVDAGIRTNQPTQDAKYLLDDQTNGASTLTTSGLAAKSVMSVTGSGTCRSSDPLLNTAYPASYPLQGKVVTKFDQNYAPTPTGALIPIQMQSYIRLGSDPLDPDGDVTVTGIVMKGPGLGGTVKASLSIFPTNSVKNLNPIDCIVASGSSSGNASIAEMSLAQSDGSDLGSAIDPWVISIP